MVFGMTLDQQIKAARKALEELIADEAELSRLEAEQVAEISALKASGSRDFAGLATLEGKRAALASMLSEQRASIDAARAEVSQLEAEQATEEKYAQLAAVAAQIDEKHRQFKTGVQELESELHARLLVLFQIEGEWTMLRPQWIRLARELGQDMTPNSAASEAIQPFYADLEARGVNVTALRVSRPYMVGIPAGLVDNSLTPVQFGEFDAPSLERRLHALVMDLYSVAFRAHLDSSTRAGAAHV